MRVALFLVLLPAIANAEITIVPLYGSTASGYRSTLIFFNESDATVTLRIKKALPMERVPNRSRGPFPTLDFTFQPRGGGMFDAGVLLPGGEWMVLGAMVLESNGPVRVENWAHKGNRSSAIQVEIADSWIPPNRDAWIPMATQYAEPINLFLINPTNQPSTIEYSMHFSGIHTAIVQPESVILLRLDTAFMCPRGCAFIATFPFGSGFPVRLRANTEFQALASNQGIGLPPIARVARIAPTGITP